MLDSSIQKYNSYLSYNFMITVEKSKPQVKVSIFSRLIAILYYETFYIFIRTLFLKLLIKTTKTISINYNL